MKKIFIILTFMGFSFLADAQTCQSGKLDSRIEMALKTSIEDLPGSSKRTVEQYSEVKISTPEVQYIKVTSDSIPIQIYNPAQKKGLPIMISFHPGGFVTPILPFMEYEFLRQTKTFNAIVVAVDFRVAPENKFPAAVNDAYNAFRWVAENGQTFGGDTSRIMVFGSSSGGNLAAVVCQIAKKDALAQKIKLQVLFCPPTDDPRNADKYPSYQKYASGFFLTKPFCQYYIRAYAPDEHTINPEVGPINNKDLRGLPPAVVITAEFDPLRDEGAAYAERLQKAGVPRLYKCFPGQIHCLIGLPPDADELKELDDLIITAMNEFLN
ncbi:MAG: alpha/beta hydrolase [Cyclobacteriaceae bacterium]|nr:alpha/beta hydrolase [Cyclobacteriaceae bacterium]